MNVLALGGCGDMGRMVVAILLESPKISLITIADKNYELAKTIVEMIGSDKLSAFEIDVNDSEKLFNLIASHDIVMNTVGPFYKFAKMILEACIKAKKPYIDICDDWKPTLDLLDMDEKAKTAGISAIIGIGASPGITNLLAVLACSKLDEVDELITAWGFSEGKEGKRPRYYVTGKMLKKKLGPPPERANAAVEHLLFETLEKIPTFKNGKIIEIDALTEAEPLQFPGFKDTYVCHIGHPETVTLPRIIKAKTISLVMFLGETATDLTREYRQKILEKKLTITEAAIVLDREFKNLIKRARMGRAPIKEYIGMPPSLCVIATGTKDGKRKKVAIALGRNPYDEMAGLTGVPLAIATIMMIEGKIKGKGVLTPEESIDPDEFFDKLAPYCGKNLMGKDILLKREVEL